MRKASFINVERSGMRTLVLLFVLFALALAPAAFAANATSVAVTVGAEGLLTIPAATTLSGAGGFTSFTGSTAFKYMIRTNTGGSVTLQVSTDFSPANGPSVATPPTVGDALTYSCTAAGNSAPTACSGPLTASTTSTTSVLTVGANKYSAASPGDSGTVNWTLTNDPKYKIGTYTATVQFTISAT
jgi:hypothetical protein